VLRTGHINNEWCFALPLAHCETYFIDPVIDFDPADYDAYPFDCSQGCRRCVVHGGECTLGGPVVYGCSPPPSPPALPPSAPPTAACPELHFTLDRTRRLGKMDEAYCWNTGVGKLPYNEQLKTVCESFFVEPILGVADDYPFDCSLGCATCVYEPVPSDTSLYRCSSGPIITGCPAPG
jgi:hypothetical protein